MERPRRPRVEAIVLYHASVARLKKIQGMFGIIRHNSGPGGICKLIFAVLESQNTVFFTPYHWFSPILSSQNHHTTPYRYYSCITYARRGARGRARVEVSPRPIAVYMQTIYIIYV